MSENAEYAPVQLVFASARLRASWQTVSALLLSEVGTNNSLCVMLFGKPASLNKTDAPEPDAAADRPVRFTVPFIAKFVTSRAMTKLPFSTKTFFMPNCGTRVTSADLLLSSVKFRPAMSTRYVDPDMINEVVTVEFTLPVVSLAINLAV